MQLFTLLVKGVLLASFQTILASPVPANSHDLSVRESSETTLALADVGLETLNLSNDETVALQMHNQARAEKSIPALKWDAGLQQSALSYAKKLAQKNGGLDHSQAGENLSKAPKSNVPLATGTSYWTNEKKNYNGQKIPEGNFPSYGHYTQVMWKNTQKVGIASARGANGYDYIVAHYSPAGNVVGQKPW